MPVMSDGIRSGVNWMRLKLQPTERASAFASIVLPMPGTSSISTWPPHSIATSASSITSLAPDDHARDVLAHARGDIADRRDCGLARSGAVRLRPRAAHACGSAVTFAYADSAGQDTIGTLMRREFGIHHLTVAVHDVDAGAATFAALFGATRDARAVTTSPRSTRAASTRRSAGTTLQLVAARRRTTRVTRFLERKGEGFYNLALEVDDLDAAVARAARKRRPRQRSRRGEPGLRSAFVTMAATHGLSIQLVEVKPEFGSRKRDRSGGESGRRR